jgi:predicted acylesterase/phospholipase RssA
MSQAILLKEKNPDNLTVDKKKIGISYSGGGPLVVVELGIARAFVQEGIIPDVITGVSAGALAGTAHALDVRNGTGIDMAQALLSRVSNSTLGLDPVHVLGRVILGREHTTSLGDNAPLGSWFREGLKHTPALGLTNVTIGTFTPPRYPKLMIAATDALDGTSVWFPDETPIEDALIASSAIPGVFPWRTMLVEGRERTLVDGGVVTNQPLSNLVNEGCGTIWACAVGPTDPLPPPTNGLDNALRSVNMTMHQCSKLEEDYVCLKLGNRGVVHHIHPILSVPIHEFDFSAALVQQVMDDACAKTRAWLAQIKKAAQPSPPRTGRQRVSVP